MGSFNMPLKCLLRIPQMTLQFFYANIYRGKKILYLKSESFFCKHSMPLALYHFSLIDLLKDKYIKDLNKYLNTCFLYEI